MGTKDEQKSMQVNKLERFAADHKRERKHEYEYVRTTTECE